MRWPRLSRRMYKIMPLKRGKTIKSNFSFDSVMHHRFSDSYLLAAFRLIALSRVKTLFPGTRTFSLPIMISDYKPRFSSSLIFLSSSEGTNF
jgi:hypothetical protein